MGGMELYDLGETSWLETQLIYHALPRLGRPALVVCWPDRPYVCLGFSQDPGQEVDPEYCRRRELPVFRRAVGGGLVYLDRHQVFFQLVLPRRGAVPPAEIYRRALAPVTAALAALGVAASFRPAADLTVRGRKISGNGGGEIAGHPVVVGNVLLDFDFETMAGALKAPEPVFRRLVGEMMRRRLTTLRRELGRTPARRPLARLMIESFARAFGPFRRGRVDGPLRLEMDLLAAEMSSPDWPDLMPRPAGGRDVKIAEGAYVRHRSDADGGLWATWAEEEGLLRRVVFGGPATAGRTGEWQALAKALADAPLDAQGLAARLDPWLRSADRGGVAPQQVLGLIRPDERRESHGRDDHAERGSAMALSR